MEEIQNVLGDSVPEWSVIDAVVTHQFHFEKSLDHLLRQQQGDGDEAASDIATTADEDGAFETSDGSAAAPTSTSAASVPMVVAASTSRLFPSARSVTHAFTRQIL